MKILDMLVSNLSGLDFPMFAYLSNSGEMYRIEKGEIFPMPVSDTLMPGLLDRSKSVIYFKKESEIISFFFFRIQSEDNEVVLVIQDGKGGTKTAQVLSLFAARALDKKDAPESVFKSFNADESLRRELEKMIGRVTDLEISVTEKETRISELQRRLFAQNELLDKLEQNDNSQESALLDEIMELKEQIIAKNETIGSLKAEVSSLQIEKQPQSISADNNEDIQQLKNEIANQNSIIEDLRAEIASMEIEAESLGGKLESYDDVLSDNDVKLSELEVEIEEQNESLAKAEELNHLLQLSRNKIRKLMDGMPMPLFSVDKDYIIKNVNRVAGNFAGDIPLNEIVGQFCYKTFYDSETPCSWCHLNEAMEGKETISNIDIFKEDKLYRFEQRMYPVQNNDGEIDEAGELLFDVTEQYELINSLENYRGQIKKYKLAKLNDISEIDELRKEYTSMSESYDDLQNKFHKMRAILERLLAEDKMNELLRTRNENAELRNKLTRAASALKNYQVNLDESRTRYTDLNKKTVYQLERLINVLNNKLSLKQPEVEQSLVFVNNEIARLKRDYDKLCDSKSGKTSVNVNEPLTAEDKKENI